MAVVSLDLDLVDLPSSLLLDDELFTDFEVVPPPSPQLQGPYQVSDMPLDFDFDLEFLDALMLPAQGGAISPDGSTVDDMVVSELSPDLLNPSVVEIVDDESEDDVPAPPKRRRLTVAPDSDDESDMDALSSPASRAARTNEMATSPCDAAASTPTAVVHTMPLPPAPARHPSTNQINRYDPSAPWDPDATCDFQYLLDRDGDAPNRSYLVLWKTQDLQLSYVWEEELEAFGDLRARVDAWVEAGRPSSFVRFAEERFGGATASTTGRCFLEALRAASVWLGDLDLVTEEHWAQFEVVHTRDMRHGVKRQDKAAFFKFLQSRKVALDFKLLFKSRVTGSITSTEQLQDFACEELEAGCYLVCAGEALVDHCFLLVVGTDGKLLISDNSDDLGSLEPLEHIQWIRYVRYIHRIAKAP